MGEKRKSQILKEKISLLERKWEAVIIKNQSSSKQEVQQNITDINLQEGKYSELEIQSKLAAMELKLKKVQKEKEEQKLELEKLLTEKAEKQDQILNLEETLANNRLTQNLPWEKKIPWESNNELKNKPQKNIRRVNVKKRKQSLIPTLKTPAKIDKTRRLSISTQKLKAPQIRSSKKKNNPQKE